MTFRNDQQRARVCRKLFGKIALRELWSDSGPSAEARRLLASEASELSGEKRTIFLLAWELWHERTDLTFHDLRTLSKKRLHLIGSLLTAMAEGSEAVERWLDER